MIDPDAPTDAPDTPGTTITVETEVLPSLVAYREGSGEWKTPTKVDDNTYEFEVRGPYVATVVCEDEFGITTWQVAQTPDDEPDVFGPCFGAAPEQHEVTGRVVQAGTVTAGFFSDRSTVGNWDFSLFVDAGVTDLFAFNANRIVARRDLVVGGPTTVTPALDLRQGTALVAAPLTATNALPGETVNASINVQTGNFTFVRLFRGLAAAAKVAPDSFLVLGDRQTAAVTAFDGAGSRTLRRATFRAGDSTEFTLPDALGAVTYAEPSGQLAFTWTTLPELDIVDATVDAATPDFSVFFFHDLVISADYIAETGATSATFDTDIPGYKPEWRIDYTKEYARSVNAIDFRAGQSATSSRFETVNQAPSVTASESRRATRIDRVLERRELRRTAR